MNTRYKILIVLWVLFCCIPCTGWMSEEEGLRPLLEEIQVQVQERRTSCNTSQGPFVISIAGCAGVGKSTFASLLQGELTGLGISTVVINQDHYELSQKERTHLSGELDPRRMRWDVLHDSLRRICAGEKTIVKPTINQLTKEIGQEILQLKGIDCVLFEGIYVLGDFPPMDLLQYKDMAIYLESSLENIYNWKWEREFKKSVQRTPEVFFHHMMAILHDFAFHVYPTRKNADTIIEIDYAHHYHVVGGDKVAGSPQPDFTALRLKTLTY